MALPDELIDELLSAYLDGAASGDERARVEQFLRDDPAIAERFRQMREIRNAFRESRSGGAGLPEDFAERVLSAAIDRAESEALPADHPLRQAAAEPVVRVGSDRTVTRRIAWIVGLAAAVLIAALVSRGFDGQPPAPIDPPRIAQNDDSSAGEPAVDRAAVDRAAATPEMSPQTAETMLADSDRDSKTMPESMDAVESAPAPAMPERSAAAEQTPALAAVSKPLQMLMVVEVTLTEAGRDVDAFRQALSAAQIEIGDEREVDEQLARTAIDEVVDEETLDQPSPRMLLLESSAKKLDLLVSELATKREHVQALGFTVISVATDPALLRAIEAVRVSDPTKIRHGDIGVPLSGASERVFAAFSGRLSDRQFAPMEDAKMVAAVADNGPDQIASILFLVR